MGNGRTDLYKTINKMIDLDSTNPNWQLAKAHAQSTKAGKPLGDNHQVERCPCCLRAIQKEPIGLFQNAKELQALGYAYPLFFTFLKYVLILLFFQVCCYNILQLYNGIQYSQTFCQSLPEDNLQGPLCSVYFVRIANLVPEVTDQEVVMRVCSFAIQLVMLFVVRNKIIKTLKYYQQRESSLADYSILVKGMPSVHKIRQKLYRLFEQYFSVPVKIEQCILIGNLHDYYQLKHKKKKWLAKRRSLLKKKVVDQEKVREVDDYLLNVENMLQKQTQKMVTLTKEDNLLCEKAIIVVETDPIKKKALDEFNEYLHRPDKASQLATIMGCTVKQLYKMRMDQAPQPQQIIWKHINTPRSTKRVLQLLGWFFTILFMAAITGIFYLAIKQKSYLVQHQVEILREEKEHGQAPDDQGLQAEIILLVYFFIFLVVLLNKFAITKFLHFISEFEKHSTHSKEEFYFSLKYTVTLFLTTAVMTLLVEGVTFNNVFEYEFGIVEEESIMFMVNGFFIPFLWLVNPLQIFRVIQRRKKYGRQELTQREANHIMMDEPAALGKHFAQTIQIIWFTFMYSCIIPAGALIIMAGLSINYWVVKFTILRRCSLTHKISGSFVMFALALLDISLIMKPIGQMIFDSSVREGVQTESIVCLSIGAVYCLLPSTWLIDRVHEEKFYLHQKTYNEAKQNFVASYHMLHPIYSLKKIFVQKEVEKLRLYHPDKGVPSHLLKLPANIDQALRRPTQQLIIKKNHLELEMSYIQTDDPPKTDDTPAIRVSFI